VKRKLGGLPLYVWAGVLVGGLLLGLYLRSRSSSSSDGAYGTSDGSTGGGGFAGYPVADFASNAGGGGVSPDYGAGVPSDFGAALLSGVLGQSELLGGIATNATDGALTLADRDSDRAHELTSQMAGLIVNVPSSSAGAAPTPAAVSTATPKPGPKPAAPKPVRYYTFAHGKAPKGRKADEAPAGARYRAGKGYYV
jgi:hypothetical protein